MNNVNDLNKRYALLLVEKRGVDETLMVDFAGGKGKAVKYDFLLSNPPYQAGVDSGATSIYHLFMLVAKEAAKNVSMIYPARWLVGGSGEGIDAFRNIELASKHYSKFVVLSDASKLFKGVDIKGGINYFLWKNKRNNNDFDYYYDGLIEKRGTLLNGFESTVINPLYSDLVKALNTKNHVNISNSMTYGINVKNEINLKKYIKLNSHTNKQDRKTKVFYLNSKKELKSEIVNYKILSKDDSLYKVVFSRTANPEKSSLRRVERIFMLEPGCSFSDSFITLEFETIKESENCLLYLKTDLVNFLIGILAITQDAYRKVYSFVPDVNFATGEIVDKPGVKLDFSKPETLDDQLAKIYGLTDEDRGLITSSIRPWKDKTSLTADRGK